MYTNSIDIGTVEYVPRYSTYRHTSAAVRTKSATIRKITKKYLKKYRYINKKKLEKNIDTPQQR